MERWNLSDRKVTHVGQQIRGSLNLLRDDLTRLVNVRLGPGGTLLDVKPHFLNMDQTAIYFESRSNYTVAKKGAKNVPTKGNSSDSKQCTVVVTIAADGTKFPPFFIFKGVPGRPLERRIPELNIKGCCQRNGWNLFHENGFRQSSNPMSDTKKMLLLVDNYRVHFLQSFVKCMQQHWGGT
jgi:hypothetical protein